MRALQLELWPASWGRAAGMLVLYFVKGAQATMDGVSLGLSFIAGMLGWFTLVFMYNLVMTPSRLWHESQAQITSLMDRLTPKIMLDFGEHDCLQYVSRGRTTVAKSGMRYTDLAGQDFMVKMRCTNTSGIDVDECKRSVKADVVLDNGRRVRRIHDPIPLRWSSLGDENVNCTTIQSGIKQYIDVLIQTGVDGIPIIAGAPLLFRHERALEITWDLSTGRPSLWQRQPTGFSSYRIEMGTLQA